MLKHFLSLGYTCQSDANISYICSLRSLETGKPYCGINSVLGYNLTSYIGTMWLMIGLTQIVVDSKYGTSLTGMKCEMALTCWFNCIREPRHLSWLSWHHVYSSTQI